jgi:hypothetical protein
VFKFVSQAVGKIQSTPEGDPENFWIDLAH